MLRLKVNGKVVEVGDANVMDAFETRVTRWNNETSGWDAEGNFLSVSELDDVQEMQDSRDPMDDADRAKDKGGAYDAYKTPEDDALYGKDAQRIQEDRRREDLYARYNEDDDGESKAVRSARLNGRQF